MKTFNVVLGTTCKEDEVIIRIIRGTYSNKIAEKDAKKLTQVFISYLPACTYINIIHELIKDMGKRNRWKYYPKLKEILLEILLDISIEEL